MSRHDELHRGEDERELTDGKTLSFWVEVEVKLVDENHAGGSHVSPPQKIKLIVVGDGIAAGKRGGDPVRGTKYEVKELGATELRKWKRWMQSRNDAWRANSCSCEDDALLGVQSV